MSGSPAAAARKRRAACALLLAVSVGRALPAFAQSDAEPGGVAPLGPPSDRAAYGRAALENLGVLAIGVAQYWLAAGHNRSDWDYPGWSERFELSSARFDNNTHITNNLLHPLAGAAYYGLSRANGLSIGESVLYAQLSSAIWEWGLEWREKVSINDMIATTAAGTAAGEFLVQLSAYLNSAPEGGGVPQRVAASTLGFPVWVHDQLDQRGHDARPAKDRLGFSSAYQHRFTLDLQNAWLDDGAGRSETGRGLRLAAQLSSLRRFLEPVTFAVPFARGNFSEASLELEFDGSGLQAADVEFDAILAGYYAQWADLAVTGLIVGLGTGLEFVDRTGLRRGDQYALAHFAGPSLVLFRNGQSFGFTLASRLYGDFAPIRSLAWSAVQRAEPEATYKSTLERSYQYHLGYSQRSYLMLRFHALQLAAEYSSGRYQSIEGLDRFQERVTRDLEGTEWLDERRVLLALEPPQLPLRTYVGVERFSHVSELGGASSTRLERRLVTGLGLVF